MPLLLLLLPLLFLGIIEFRVFHFGFDSQGFSTKINLSSVFHIWIQFNSNKERNKKKTKLTNMNRRFVSAYTHIVKHKHIHIWKHSRNIILFFVPSSYFVSANKRCGKQKICMKKICFIRRSRKVKLLSTHFENLFLWEICCVRIHNILFDESLR